MYVHRRELGLGGRDRRDRRSSGRGDRCAGSIGGPAYRPCRASLAGFADSRFCAESRRARAPHAPVAPAAPDARSRTTTTCAIDPWFWLRERDDPEVLAYLEAENAYTDAVARAPERRCGDGSTTRSSAASRRPTSPRRCAAAPCEYFTRTVEGLQYGVHCRRPAGVPGCPIRSRRPGSTPGELVVLDENALADGSRLLRGRRPRGEPRPDASPRTPSTRPAASATSCASASPSTTAATRPRRRRRRRVLRRRLGQRRRDDLLRAPRRRHAPVAGVAPPLGTAAERRRPRVPGGRRPLLRGRRPHAQRPLRRDHERVEGHERGVAGRRRRRRTPRRVSSSHACRATSTTSSTTTGRAGDRLFVLTNADGAENFALDGHAGRRRPDARRLDRSCSRTATTSGSTTSTRSPASSWCRSAPTGSSGSACSTSATTARSPTTTSRDAGAGVLGVARRQPRVRRHDRCGTGTRRWCRRPSAYDYDLATRDATLVKRQPVLGLRPRRSTRPTRLWATAPDGTAVPISIVLPRATRRIDGAEPVLLYGYGSYEISIDPTFSSVAREPARPRLRVRDRARPRRRRARPALVRRRQAAAQDATRSPTSSPAPSTS